MTLMTQLNRFYNWCIFTHKKDKNKVKKKHRNSLRLSPRFTLFTAQCFFTKCHAYLTAFHENVLDIYICFGYFGVDIVWITMGVRSIFASPLLHVLHVNQPIPMDSWISWKSVLHVEMLLIHTLFIAIFCKHV